MAASRLSVASLRASLELLFSPIKHNLIGLQCPPSCWQRTAEASKPLPAWSGLASTGPVRKDYSTSGKHRRAHTRVGSSASQAWRCHPASRIRWCSVEMNTTAKAKRERGKGGEGRGGDGVAFLKSNKDRKERH